MHFAAMLIFSIFFSSICQAQNRGSLTTMEKYPKVCISNTYFYQAPKYLALPDTLEALVSCKGNQSNTTQYITLTKKENKYRFSFTAPDSAAVLLIAIVDAKVNFSDYSPFFAPKKNVVDNNSGNGFLIYLYSKQGNKYPDEGLQCIKLLSDFKFYMDLKELSADTILERYKKVYTKNPQLKKEDTYLNYLKALYSIQKEKAKPALLHYASAKISKPFKEDDLIKAAEVYGVLKMDDERQKLENNILHKYPNGHLANERFWQMQFESNSKKRQTEQDILAEMKEYIGQYNDTTKNDFFYGKIVSLLFDTANWDAGLKYEPYINNKWNCAYINNKYAKKLADLDMYQPGEQLNVAKMLSGKAIDYISEEIQTKKGKTDLTYLLGAYYNYLNTYALILYKLNQYDSAFYYQDIMYNQKSVLNIDGLERYGVYSEKFKGIDFARRFLEKELLGGAKSEAMITQLQKIYKILNLPNDEFENLFKRNQFLTKQKNAERIKKLVGTTKAFNFSLKNLSGEVVSLSALKNKIIVLDFWATWCGPCKASFPRMQQLVEKYKSDTSVVFLFIDVWENKDTKTLAKTIKSYLKENNYHFNVLLDENNIAARAYKLNAIPKKFIIDKNGNIVFISDDVNYLDDITQAIEAAMQ